VRPPKEEEEEEEEAEEEKEEETKKKSSPQITQIQGLHRWKQIGVGREEKLHHPRRRAERQADDDAMTSASVASVLNLWV
jgi:hypothetical protein